MVERHGTHDAKELRRLVGEQRRADQPRQPQQQLGGRRRTVSLDALLGSGDELRRIKPGDKTVQTLPQVELGLRVDNVQRHMKPADWYLVAESYIGQRSQRDLATELGISQPAVLKRLRAAEANFKAAFAAHFWDELPPGALQLDEQRGRAGHNMDREYDRGTSAMGVA